MTDGETSNFQIFMYNYETEKPGLFTDEGQRLFLKIRDRAKGLLKLTGAVRSQELIHGNTGSTWIMLACIDRMVELGEIRELTPKECAGQNRVFVSMSE